jgi:hypothetical protein
MSTSAKAFTPSYELGRLARLIADLRSDPDHLETLAARPPSTRFARRASSRNAEVRERRGDA